MQRRHMIVFRPGHNSHGKRDVTGAFAPEAERYMDAVCTKDSPLVIVDNKKSFVRRQAAVSGILAELSKDEDWFDGVAFFCHGWKTGIQLGFKNKHVFELSDRIHELCQHSFIEVPLFCCSTGGDVKTRRSSPGTGDNSFADLLRDALCERSDAHGYASYCRVMAHETVAHTTKNPRVRFFDGMGSPEGGVGGFRPVKPRGRLWKAWKRELRAKNSELRFRMPHMSVLDIATWLEDA